MNFSSLIGLTFGISVMYEALALTSDNMKMFLSLHGILIVCGGTAAATSISYPLRDIFNLLKVFLLRVLGRNHINFQLIISQIIELNKKSAQGIASISELIPQLKHEFLKEAVSLIVTGILTEQEIRAALEQRIKTIQTRYLYEANMFRTIGRFPPAFGLLATTLGMIDLLQKLGQPDSQKMIGPSMSIGLVGTLYGITLSNLILIPIAENLTERTHEEIALRKMIIEGAILIKTQVNPIAMRERMNSYLLPRHRLVRAGKA